MYYKKGFNNDSAKIIHWVTLINEINGSNCVR